MVRDDSIRCINTVRVLLSKISLVWSHSTDLLRFLNDRREKLCVIVRPFPLYYGHKPFKTHCPIDVVFGKGPMGTITFAIKLDEDNVPEFEHVWVILVHQVRGVAATNPIEVNFAVQDLSLNAILVDMGIYVQGPQGPVPP